MVLQARKLLQEARTAAELRAAQSVLLVADHGRSIGQTAEMLGCSVPTVSRLRRWLKDKPSGRGDLHQHWGGRRRQNLSLDQELRFLEPFLDQARTGGVVTIGPIWRAYEAKLGRPVPDSTIYRLLWRHDWRKLAPDTHHPKGDPAARIVWKKNSASGSKPGARKPKDARSV
jgi:transposase